MIVGNVLKALYEWTGLKMSAFTKGVPYSSKTIYYHFAQDNLNTSILEKYERGLKKLGYEVDVFELITRARRGEEVQEVLDTMGQFQEPAPRYGAPRGDDPLEAAAQALREGADLLDRARRGEGGLGKPIDPSAADR